MKRFLLSLWSIIAMLPMSAQDTIPYSNTILSYPFSYHHYDSISMSTIPCSGLNCYNYPPYSIHNEWYMQYRETNEPLVYGIAITTTPNTYW
jgi:hypothetical protein